MRLGRLLGIVIFCPIIPVAAETLLTGPVTHVRDGDTLEVRGIPVRLEGLHCPEWDEPGGEAAAAALRALVGSQPVSCALTGERTHDRWVGRCEVDGRDLGAEMIVSGYCTRCARHGKPGGLGSAKRNSRRR